MATVKQARIIDTAKQLPTATSRQIAKLCDTDRAHVSKVLKRYDINHGQLADYKTNKADIWQGLSHRLLSNLTPEQIKKASALQLVTAAGIAESKYLEMSAGKSDVQPMVVINSLTVNPVEGKQAASPVIDVTPENVGK
jgi:hypothetical protein